MGHAFWKQKSDIEFNIVRNTQRIDLKITLGLRYLNFHYKLFLTLLGPSDSSLWYRLVIFSIFGILGTWTHQTKPLVSVSFPFFQSVVIIQWFFFSMIAEKKSCKLISHFCHFVNSWTTANRQKIENSIEGFYERVYKLPIRNPEWRNPSISFVSELQWSFWALSEWYLNFLLLSSSSANKK